MKQCPSCSSIYADDLSFCLQDGTPLAQIVERIDSAAQTAVTYDTGRAKPTEILPNPRATAPTAVIPTAAQSTPARFVPGPVPVVERSTSKLPYVFIGFLLFTCVGLAAALVVLNLDRIFPQNSGSSVSAANDAKTARSPVPANIRTASVPAATPTPKMIPPAPTVSAAGKWKGDWSTTSGTVLDIEITLNDTADNGLDGQIRRTLLQTARPDKTD